MLYLRNVLQLINHRFNDRTLTSEELVSQAHQLVLHVAPRFGKELDVERSEQPLCQLLRNVASISKDFAAQHTEQIFDGLTVVSVARRERDVE